MNWYETPGVYENIPEAEYHAAPLLSSTGLAQLNRSPAHFGVPVESSAFALGKVFHCLVLEPERFDDDFAICPVVDLRTKVGKATYAEFCEANEGKEIIRENIDDVRGMAESLRAHPIAGRIIRERLGTEVTLVWEERGIMCKARLDVQMVDGAADLKKCANGSPDAFQRSIVNYMYHQQAAHYMRGMAATSLPAVSWCWPVVEPKPPYACAVYHASEALLEAGDAIRSQNIDRYLSCKFTGEWPAYESGVIDLPYWYARNIEEIEEDIAA